MPEVRVEVVVKELVVTHNGNFYSPADPGEMGTKIRRLSVTSLETEILAEVARGHRVLEIGTGLGVSTVALAKDAEYVWTIDPDPWVQENVWPDLTDTGKVTTAHQVPDVELQSLWFTLAFVDGDHGYDSVLADLEAVKRLILPMCPVLMHDYKYTGVVTAAKDSGFQVIREFGGPCNMALGVLG